MAKRDPDLETLEEENARDGEMCEPEPPSFRLDGDPTTPYPEVDGSDDGGDSGEDAGTE